MRIPDRHTELLKAIKFGIVGVSNTLVDMGLFALLGQLLGVNQYLASTLSYAAGMLNSYLWNRSWTFGTRQGFWSRALVRFMVTNLVMLGLSLGILWLCTAQLGLHKLLGKLISIVVVMAVNFVISRLWVFSS